MQKDLKIGLAVGSSLVAIAVIWLATRPSLTPQARLASAPSRQAKLQNLHNADTGKESVVQPETRYSMSDERESNPEVPRENPVSSIENSESGIQNHDSSIENPVSSIENEPIKTEKFHIVRKGDTLSMIAYKYYGTASKWQKIFEKNRNTISDANKLTIGIKLIIPD